MFKQLKKVSCSDQISKIFLIEKGPMKTGVDISDDVTYA